VEHLRNFSGAGAGNRRRDDRVRGPFTGLEIGPIDRPVRIYDLSESGCFVTSVIETPPSHLTLKVYLPHEGWISVKTETVRSMPGHGYTVRFIEISDDSRVRLERSLRQLQLENAWLTANPR